MRNTFFDLLLKEMAHDSKIFILAADMGLGLMDPFMEQYPDRFLNVGIAESNMIGIAAGLCNTGYRPFCYTITNFLIQRAYEQIRNDMCLHNYPITLVGTSTGYDNGLLGPTHHAIDDMGCLKCLPGMTLYSPSSIGVTQKIINRILSDPSPSCVRIGKGASSIDESDAWDINGFIRNDTKESDTVIISYGTVLSQCVKAFERDPFFSVYRLDCLNTSALKHAVLEIGPDKTIVVVEEQIASCGAYNALCQAFAEQHIHGDIYNICPPEHYEFTVGTDAYFSEKYGYTSERILDYVSALAH